MSFIKSLGVGMYYRLRRISKAMKNWKKFGVIIFGSMLLAMSTGLASQNVADASNSLSYLYIDPASIAIEAGKTYQLTAKAYDGDWKLMTAVTPTWSVVNPTAGKISATGLFTASTTVGTYSNAIKVSAGALSAYAKVQVLKASTTVTGGTNTINLGGNATGQITTNVNGLTAGNNTANLTTVNPAVTSSAKLTYLYVDPAAISLNAGATYKFTYRAYDQNWKPMSVTPTWSINRTGSGSITSAGLFAAGSVKGTYDNAVKLSVGALSAYAKVVVLTNGNGGGTDTTSKLTYLYVDPAAISLNAGATYQFNYKAYDQNWKPMSITPTWSINRIGAGTVSGTGLFTAGSVKGTYENAVKLSSGALSAYARVVVLTNGGGGDTTSKLTYLYIDPVAISVKVGHSYTFTYRAYDQNWKPVTVPVTWSMNKPVAGTVDGNGNFTASQVKGTYENAVKVSSGALSAMARVVVYDDGVVPPTEVCSSVSITANQFYLEKNQSAVVNYTSSTNQGHSIPDSDLIWSVNGGVFNSNTHTYTATQVGDYTISVQCRLNPAVNDSADIHVSDVIINQEYLASTTISADRNPLCLNQSTNLSAQAKNNLGQNITNATYTWQWLGGTGYLAGDLNSQYGARFVATNSTGYGQVRVTARWNNQTVTNEMTISVYDCSNPNNPHYFIDGYILSATDDGKPVCAGSILNYTIVLTNRFNTVNGVRLSTSLPLGVTFMSASSYTDSPNITGRTISWNPGTMTQGQSVTLNIKVKVNDDIRVGTNLRLSAFVQANEKPDGFYLSSGDLVVRCGGTTPKNPLPSTGAEIWMLVGLAVVSFGLSFLTYRWFDRRTMNRI